MNIVNEIMFIDNHDPGRKGMEEEREEKEEERKKRKEKVVIKLVSESQLQVPHGFQLTRHQYLTEN